MQRPFVVASQELERLLGGDPGRPATVFSSTESRDKLRKLIERTVLSGDAASHERDADLMWRQERAAILAAGGSIAATAPPDWQHAPAGGDGLAAVSSPAAERLSAGGDGASALPPAAPAAPPPPSSAQTSPRENKPSNPPPGPREVWRDHLGPDGSIIAPWFNPYG